MSRLLARRQLAAAGFALALAVPLLGFAAPTAVAADSGSTTFKVLRKGTDGPRVNRVQRTLDVRPVTGYYNDSTRKAVRQFQDRRNFDVTGIVNERTWTAINAKWENTQQRRARINNKYERIMKVARNQKGDPYVFGAAGPGAFDCSGYTLFVYRKAAGVSMQHLATAQYRKGDRITRQQARRGDLVFFHSGGNIYHVAIYAGHGKIWHASRSGTPVKKDPIWTKSVYYGRILPKA
jgi:cell wall-associated NlpC family hydrolase